MRRIIILIIITFCGLSGYFYLTNLGLKNSIEQLDNAQKQEFKQKIRREGESIKQQLDEKYHTDTVSFEAMFRRLELEETRVKELTEELKNQRTEEQ